MGSKIFMPKKFCVQKHFASQKIFGPRKFLSFPNVNPKGTRIWWSNFFISIFFIHLTLKFHVGGPSSPLPMLIPGTKIIFVNLEFPFLLYNFWVIIPYFSLGEGAPRPPSFYARHASPRTLRLPKKNIISQKIKSSKFQLD